MSWKDQYRDHKKKTGLTWDQYVDQYLVHEAEIGTMKQDVEDLTKAVEALRHELMEQDILDGKE